MRPANQPHTTLVVSTRNPHKLEEIQAILGSGFCCVSLKNFPDAPAVVEDANTFEGNATRKAVQLAKWLSSRGRLRDLAAGTSRVFVLADDSGLEVDALDGAPGVNSARFASNGREGNSPDAQNNAKLLRLLKEVPPEKRTARFRCVLALTPLPETGGAVVSSPVCLADEAELATELFHGTCEGRIGFAPQGECGFGYDPLFLPEGMAISFAQLGAEQKNRISHRAKALAQLQAMLRP